MTVEGSGSGRELQTPPLQEPGFEFCAVLRPCASFFTLHCSSSLSCVNEYWAIDMCKSSLHVLIVAYGWMLPREAEMVSE